MQNNPKTSKFHKDFNFPLLLGIQDKNVKELTTKPQRQ